MPGKVVGVLDRVFFRPDSLGPDAVLGLALAAPVLAGLLLFRAPAAEFLALALVIGGLAHLAGRLLALELQVSPVLLALMGVALTGPLSPLVWPMTVVILASVLELLRCRLWPRAKVNAGLAAYAAVYFLSHGAVAAYQRPGDPRLFPEPIAQWSQFYGGAVHFIEPITLYVGNVAGPVFATSVLAVAIGMAWLWYARRLSIIAAIAFLLAGTAMAIGLRWDPLFQLDSGPAWFVVGFVLCDRRQMPEPAIARPVMAVAVAVFGLGLRAEHLYIEAVFLAVVAVELLFAVIETIAVFATRRLARPSPPRVETESAAV